MQQITCFATRNKDPQYLLSADDNGIVKMWKQDRLACTFAQEHEGGIVDIILVDRDKFLTTGKDGRVLIVDILKESFLCELMAPEI